MQIVVTCLAILELMKISVLKVEQDAIFGDIQISFTGKEVDLSEWE